MRVRAGVQQVFALQVNFGAPELLGEPFGKEERCGTSGVVPAQVVQLLLKVAIATGPGVGALQLFQGGHQGLGNVAAAIRTKAAMGRSAGGRLQTCAGGSHIQYGSHNLGFLFCRPDSGDEFS